MFRLIPTEVAFFDLFEQAADNAHSCTMALDELLERFDSLPDRARKVKDLEHVGDELTHNTIERLNQTFITPIDREDIHELICRVDDVLDLVETAVDRIVLFKIDKPIQEARDLAKCLVRSTAIIREMMPLLRDMKDVEQVRQKVREVHRLENEGDLLVRNAIADLFSNGGHPIEVIKWKDIYSHLEAAIDKCEDVANIIERIVVKHA